MGQTGINLKFYFSTDEVNGVLVSVVDDDTKDVIWPHKGWYGNLTDCPYDAAITVLHQQRAELEEYLFSNHMLVIKCLQIAKNEFGLPCAII